MGAVCCCLNADDFEDYVNPNSSAFRNCPCLNCFLQNFLNVVCVVILVTELIIFRLYLFLINFEMPCVSNS